MRRRRPRAVERRAGARGRRWALSRAGRVSAYEPSPLHDKDKGQRSLNLAMTRAPFRVQRLWRAAREGADLTSARFDGRALLFCGSLLSGFRQKSARRKDGSRRGLYGVAGALDREDPRARRKKKSAAIKLYEALARAGADLFERDAYGDGFERQALSSLRPWRQAQALAWWKSVGGGPWRGHRGVANIMELCAAEGARGLEQLRAAWPEACSWEALDEALGRAGSLRLEREREVMERRRAGGLKYPGWLRDTSLAMAVKKIVEERPWAIRADRTLSEAIAQSGGYMLEEARALESAAIARAEREAMEIELGAARSRGRSPGL